MKKNTFGRQLKRDKNERKALFTSLMSALVMRERIETTEAKAKSIKPEIEKLITKAKDGSNAAKAVLSKSLSRPAFEKILSEIAPRFGNRQGGYVRLIKTGNRFGDNAKAVIMEWTEQATAIVAVAPKVKKEEKPVKKAPAQKAVKKTAVKKTK